MAYQSEIEKLEQRYRENPQQWFAALADSYRKAGSLELAIDVVRAGLEKRPNYVSGHIVHGRCLVDQHQDGEAQAVFEQVLQFDAENVIAIKALAEIGERTGQNEAVRRWVGRLLEVDPMNEEAQQMMARLAEAGPPPAAVPAPAPGKAGSETALSAAGALLAEDAENEVVATPAVAHGLEAASAGAPGTDAQGSQEAFVVEQTREAEFGEGPAEMPTAPTELVGQAAEPSTASLLETMSDEPASPELVSDPGEPADAEFAIEREEPPLADLGAMAEADSAAEGDQPAQTLGLEPFDEGLAWGTGERVSRQITVADVERASHAHEASLDDTVHALPGMEGAEVPPTSVDRGETLPMIYPEEPLPATAGVPEAVGRREVPREPALTPEPEPVVTETMAELYVAQGLLDEARDTYRKLLAQRPGDPGLLARLAALEPSVLPSARRSLAAVASGGASVREFLADVFAGRPSESVPVPAPRPATPKAVRPAPPPSEPTIMDSAFDEGAGPAPSGEPTRRASDEVSLASVFGDEPPPPKTADPASGRHSGGKAFSFDEFFGTPRPSGEAGAKSADDDDFKRWLKGLKS